MVREYRIGPDSGPGAQRFPQMATLLTLGYSPASRIQAGLGSLAEKLEKRGTRGGGRAWVTTNGKCTSFLPGVQGVAVWGSACTVGTR